MSDRMQGEEASRTRLALGFVLDFLLFSAIVTPLSRGLELLGLPGSVASGLAFVVFALGSDRLFRRGAVTPGRWALGIRRVEGVHRVDPTLAGREAWWTMAIAFLGALDAGKSLLRWTAGLPPPPFFGLPLDAAALSAIVTLSGAIRFAASLFVFRGSSLAALVGVGFLGLDLASMLAAGPAFDAWIVARATAQAAARGEVPSPERIAALARYLPLGVWIAAVVGSVWLVAAAVRFRLSAVGRRP